SLIQSTGRRVRLDTVDYEERTWSTGSAKRAPGAGPLGSRTQLPDKLRTDLDQGVLRIVGREQLNGRETLHVTRTAQMHPFTVGGRTVTLSDAGIRVDYWIDVETHLPLRQTTDATSMPNGVALVNDYDWLPRTPENLAKLELHVPRGFRRQTIRLGPSFSG